jgi:hypothetical protein
MAIIRRRRKEPALAPATGPDTVVGLLVWAISDWGRTLRFITIVCSVLFGLVVSITVATILVVVATEGIRGVEPRYLLPVGVLSSASVLVGVTIKVGGYIKKKMQQRASGKPPPGTR